jgi:cyclin-dependent kinase 9
VEWLLVCVITQSSHQHTATQFNRYKGSIYLVFDFCEHDLAGLLSNANVKFTLAEIKKVMQMLLNGLYYIHRNKVRLRSIYDRLPSIVTVT